MKLAEKNQKKLLDDIQSGKYREYYLIYNRKSTDDTENQKNSIKYQKSENSRFAFRQNLPIAPITDVTDPMNGRDDGSAVVK
jgi:site-specific DNA recombinase